MRVGTRGSALALAQARWVADRLGPVDRFADGMAVRLQRQAEGPADVRLVVDDQDARHG